MAEKPDLGAVAPGEGPLDELLAALMQAGEVESAGAFTLDRKKARQKMQRFQLAQPARYVLELVQAAVLRGARHITVDIDQDDLHLRCDAAPFSLKDYEEIYDALFIPSKSPKRQALRHLALGASTALTMKPAWVRVQGGGRNGAYLQLYPGDKERMGATSDAHIGLHVHVRQRGRLGVLWRLLGYQEHRQAEFVMIREHCGLSMIPIEINGMPITVGYQLPGTMFWLTFHKGSTRGVVGVLGTLTHLHNEASLPLDYPFGLRSTLHLMRNCVSFELDQPPLLLPGFGTLVESPSFHLDISHQRVVRNDSYEEAVRLVLGQQLQLLVRECQRLLRGEQSLSTHLLEGLVLGLLARLPSLAPLLRWAGRADAGTDPLPDGFPEVVADASALLAARIWLTAQGRRVSLDELIADMHTFGTVAVTSRPAREPDRARPLVLLFSHPHKKDIFSRLFPGCLEERDLQSEQASERASNLERWRKRKQDARLPWRPYLAKVPIELQRWRGELALEPSSAAPAAGAAELRLTLIHQGGVLAVKQLAVPLPGLHAVLAGDFSPTYAWNDVEPDAKLAVALRALLEALPRLCERLLAAGAVDLHRTQGLHLLRELISLSYSPAEHRLLAWQFGPPAAEQQELAPPPTIALTQLVSPSLLAKLLGDKRVVDERGWLREVEQPTSAPAEPAPGPQPAPPQEEPVAHEQRPQHSASAPHSAVVPAVAAGRQQPEELTQAPAPAAEPPPRESAAARARRQQEELVLTALRAEIREVVGPAHKLLSSINLDRIHIGDGKEPLAVICTEYQTLINRKHPVMRRVLAQADREPALMWFLVSAVYTALNIFFEEVTDQDEAQFLILLNRHALKRLQG